MGPATSEPIAAPATALVTGASRGIGRAITLELAGRGFDVVATMRDPAAGSDLADHDRIRVERLDVIDPSTYAIPDDLRILVNNAGADSPYLPLEHADLESWRAMFETNVFGLVALTRAALPTLRATAPSVVATITSLSILTPVPFYTAYRATKAAASAVCDSLRVELEPFGVRVVEVLPGPVDTDMLRLSAGAADAAAIPDYAPLARRYAAARADADDLAVPAADAAVAIVDAALAAEGPMRHGCDPLSVSLLELWRSQGDEALYDLVARPILDGL